MACLSHRFDKVVPAAPGARMPFPEPGVAPHYGPSRTVRIERARVHLDLHPERRAFEGEATLELQQLPTYSGSFGLDLDEVEVVSVTDGDGAELSWRHEDAELHIRSERAPASVCVRWRGQDPRRGLYFTGPTAWAADRQHMAWTQCQDEDGHFVFPCHDHPGVKHPWTLSLTAPAGYTLLSNGRAVEQREQDDRVYAQYEQAEPMAAYLVTFVAAQLACVEAKWRDIPVRYLVPQGEEGAVARAMGKTPLMIELFSTLTGVDYPWPRYDQVVVHDFIFGGMENTGCTTMTDLLLVDEKAVLEWDPDALVAHELAHQWFGDLVTCQDWSQGWLNESWATVMEAMWWESDRSEADATWYRWETARGYFEEHDERYRRPIVSYRFREPIDVFDRHLYNKGSCVLWTLRHELGDDPFWAGVHLYLTRHRDQTVHTRHFQRALEDATGRNLDGFFEQWVHAPGHPQLKVALSRREGEVGLTVEQQQSGEDVPEAYHLDLRLELCLADGSTRVHDLHVVSRTCSWAIPVDAEVRTVRVDPGFRVLARLTMSGPEGWLRELLADPCPVLALRAADGLLGTDSARSYVAVRDALRAHPFWSVRAGIATRLGKRGGSDARDALLAAHAEEADPRVLRAIATALGRFREEVAADALLAALSEEADTWQLHGARLVALGKTRDPRALDELQKHLDVPSWAHLVRQKALLGLAATEDERALQVLLDSSRVGEPDRVRGTAATALARLADKREAVRTAVVDRLCDMLVEPGFRSQLMAIDGLGMLRDARGSADLSRMHRTAPDGRTRRAAYEALVRVRQGRATEEGLAPVRGRLEELAEQSARLQARLDKLESRS